MRGTGFTFKGKHCSEFNILSKTNSRPLLAQRKVEQRQMDGADGTKDLDKGRNNRHISLTCTIMEDNYVLRRTLYRKIAEWLDSDDYCIFVFDDEPDICYKSRVITSLDTTLDPIGDTFKLDFVCKPYKFSNRDRIIFTNEAISTDSNLPTDAGTRTFEMTNNATYEMLLDSTAPIQDHKIQITGKMDLIKINNMKLKNVDGTYVIDTEHKLVYQIMNDGTAKNRINNFNLIFEQIDYKKDNYVVNIQTTNQIGTGEITFFFSNTYL